jgi:hypothetical protein
METFQLGGCRWQRHPQSVEGHGFGKKYERIPCQDDVYILWHGTNGTNLHHHHGTVRRGTSSGDLSRGNVGDEDSRTGRRVGRRSSNRSNWICGIPSQTKKRMLSTRADFFTTRSMHSFRLSKVCGLRTTAISLMALCWTSSLLAAGATVILVSSQPPHMKNG